MEIYQTAVDGNAFLGAVAGGAGALQPLWSGQVDEVEFRRQSFQFWSAITPSSSRAYVARSSLSISEKREPVGPNCSGGTSCVPVPRDGQDPDTNIKLSPSNTEICVNSNLSEILSLNQLLQHYLCQQ